MLVGCARTPSIKASGPTTSAEATLHRVPPMPEPVTTRIDAERVDITALCEGRFVPFARLGVGSQGETLEGVDRQNGQLVAIKRFDVHGATSWKDVELAEREARVLSNLRHPGLARYIHHFEQKGSLYLVMERLQGEDLARCLARGKRFTFDELLSLLDGLADLLTYLHGQVPPIVHRDIKPSNLIQRVDGSYALIDFGSVRDSLRQGGSTVVGTFGYMAPEQFQGRALPASDLFGVGATLLTLMTGTTPENLPHRGLEIDVRAALPRTTPEPWLRLLQRLLTADPDRRATALGPLLAPLRVASPSAAGSEQRVASETYSSTQSDVGHTASVQPPLCQPPHAEWVFAAGTSIPFVLMVILQIVRIAAYLMMQVALPLLFGVLAVFFGRSLRIAAADISRAGRTTDQQLSELLAQLARTGPLVMSHRRNAEGSQQSPAPNETTSHASGTSRPGRKRRVRVGVFELEFPDSARDNAAADAEKSRQDQRKSR